MGIKQYVGLDLGTNSVGWAVSDENYKIQHAKGKSLWGIRLFGEADTAAERRTFRSIRRRAERKKERTRLLQELFKDEVAKVDPEFFIRLNESSLYGGDKTVKGDFSLFNDKGYTDKEYYKQYKTIYHLQKALLTEDKKFDIRLVYLAVHHLIKYRGNFLMEGQKFSNQGQENNDYILSLFQALNEKYKAQDLDGSINLNLTITDPKKFEYDVVNTIGINKTIEMLATAFGTKDSVAKEIYKAISGGKTKIVNLFPALDGEEFNRNDFCFADATFEDTQLPELQSEFDDEMPIIETLKSIFSWIQYKRILHGKTYIADAMVERYDEYYKDLATLKKLMRENYSKEEYKAMFRTVPGKEVKANYCAYTKQTIVDGHKVYSKGCSKDDFYKYVRKLLEAKADILKDNADYQIIADRMLTGQFLKKIVTTDNGVLPYQINELELKEILDRQSKYYDFLKKEEDGWTVKDKIMSIIRFRIPYYVGPLNPALKKEEGTGFSWVVRKAQGKVYPWNFDKMVDSDESENKFIENMTNKCTYLAGEDVLPKNSLAYSEYLVLNELNNISLNGQRFDVRLKNEIFNGLYKKEKKVTFDKIKKFLLAQGYAKTKDDIQLTGLADDCKASLGSFIDFSRILGTDSFDIDTREMIENIIRWIVISSDKSRIEKRIKRTYGDKLTDDQINKISALSYSGWGTMSGTLLNSDKISYVDPQTGEVMTILGLMHASQMNFMQIIFADNLGIRKAIDEFNKVKDIKTGKMTYEDIEDMNISPAVRRPVNQTLRIIRELKHVTKKDPDKIFVEVTREDDKVKKTTRSRKKQLQDLYESIGKDCEDYDELKKELDGFDDNKLKSAKLYLYFTQHGRCMYTEKKIDLDQLDNDNVYDIDHIYPQSLIKDDSFDNRVLVIKQENAKKTDEFPIDPAIQSRMGSFWRMLQKENLISAAKYSRLTRTSRLSDDELAEFVSRQLVTTSQSMKAVIEMLNKEYPNARVVWSKGGHVSDFRKDFDLLKSRTVNDYHHAKDAYLNIVVGNIFDNKFGMKSPRDYVIQKENDKTFTINPENIYKSEIKNAWVLEGNNKTIDTVRKYMSHNDILYTEMQTEGKGAFYLMNLSPKIENKFMGQRSESGPLSNIAKYGGYDSLSTAYFFLVESDGKKDQRIKTIETMPVLYASRFEHDPAFADKVMTDYFKLKNPKILMKKILVNSVAVVNGTRVHLVSKADSNHIGMSFAVQWNANKEISDYVRILDKYKAKEIMLKTFDKKHPIDPAMQQFEINGNSEEDGRKHFIISKEMNEKLYDQIKNQLTKDIYKGISLRSPISVIEKGEDTFKALDLKSQTIVLLEMMNLLSCNSSRVDFTLIGGSEASANKKINNNITDSNICLVNQSVTGLYETIRKL